MHTWELSSGQPEGPMLRPLLSAQDFTPEKKAVVRAPRRGPLAGRKKKVEVFCSHCLSVGNPERSLHGHQALSMVTVRLFWRRVGNRP